MSITFHLPSGGVAGFIEVEGLVPGDTADPSFLGFFGTGGPGNSIAVGSYQDATHRVDSEGADNGTGVNFKFSDANNVIIDGADAATLPVAVGSGSLVVRLTPGSSVQTQNGLFYAVTLNASSGVVLGEAPNNLTVQAAEVDQDSAFSDLSSDGSNSMGVTNHADAATLHDWHVGVSAKPLTTGVKNAWGFHFSVEYF
jgi:hypothetical protein